MFATVEPNPLRERVTNLAVRVARKIRPVRVRGVARILWWLAPLTLGRGTRCVPSASGVKLCVNVENYFDCMMVYGRYAPDLMALLRDVLRPGDSVIDVGAQLGFVTSNMAKLVGPQGRVHSFEADPNALERLQITLAANKHDWVEVFPFAAADREGEIEFGVSPMLGWSTAVKGTHHDDLETVTVPCRRIDDLLDEGRIRRPVTLVKLDVEGFESSVLDGMQKLIEQDRPIIVTEIAPTLLAPRGMTSVDVLERITVHDYRVFVLDQPRGVLAGEQYLLTEIDGEEPQPEFCDLVCVPRESVRRGTSGWLVR